uniref:Putative salivary secreted peptide n=2 Tax=Ixodes ricinus TaxID=34613 RepID=V5ICH0_IXORI
MASSFSCLIFVALLLVLVHQQAAGEPFTFDLYKAAERYAEQDASSQNMEVVKEDSLNESPVTVTAGPVVYGATKSSAMRPNVVYIQWVHNGQASSSQTITIQRRTEHKETATWHVEAGFSYSGSVKASAGILTIANAETEHKISLDLKGGYRKEVSKTETFSINDVVTVSPMKSVKIEWIITDAVQEVPWTSTVTITGNFFVRYRSASRSATAYFSPGILKYDNPLQCPAMNRCLYTAKGTFTGIQAHETHIRVTEYDFQRNRRRSLASAARTYTIPLSLTPHTPAAKTLQHFKYSTSEENIYSYLGIHFFNIVASVLRVTGLWS